MKFRWSDGYRHAVEFDVDHAEQMRQAMVDALIEFRRVEPALPAKLHVEYTIDRWSDVASEKTGYCRVIHRSGLPGETEPAVCGGLWHWFVGEPHWPTDWLWKGGQHALRHYRQLMGFVGDTMGAIKRHEDDSNHAET